jgi:catechol 2,3-dioxygenase-like lactoylglutathione lyase family enzyme
VKKRAGATAANIDEYGRAKNAMVQKILAAGGLTDADRASIDANQVPSHAEVPRWQPGSIGLPHLPLRACRGVKRQPRRDASSEREPARLIAYAGVVHLGLIAIVVREYDPAISFFLDVLGFELVEDSAARTNDGRAKRWVVVRPPGAATGLLLARADGEDQAAIVGKQAAGRVGFFLHVEDFDAAYARMASAGVQFLTAPRTEAYGHVAVFVDIAGNKWDLIGPAS